MMRIIAGRWRSRRLARPTGATTRPMPDRVKEAVFSMLGARLDTPGGLPPLHVADVFAGSGSMGLEALSRGANSCLFVEQDAKVLAVLRRNLDTVGAGPSATIRSGDAWSCPLDSPDGAPPALVFLDPPYRDSDDPAASGHVVRFLSRLAAAHDEHPTLIVLHHHARVRYDEGTSTPWRIDDRRLFGTSGITTFTR